MEEFLAYLGISFIASAVITPIADYGFGQHLNFFIVWVVAFFIIAFGEYIGDC